MTEEPLFHIPVPAPVTGLPEVAGGWPDDPVARVLLDSGVPHLDREFDYLVPHALDDEARPGVRVRVPFGHQDVLGWLVSRGSEPSTGAKLLPLRAVVSREQVLAPEVLDLARAVAARYAGNVADVLRVAVPPRVARVEKQMDAEAEAPEAVGTAEPDHPGATAEAPGADGAGSGPEAGSPVGPVAEAPAPDPAPDPVSTVPAAAEPGFRPDAGSRFDWTRLDGATSFFRQVTAGEGPRAAVTVPSAHGSWDSATLLTDAAARTAEAGRAAVVVVPDQRDLDRLCRALDRRVGAGAYARLTADDGPTPRYRAFLQLRRGQRRIAVGTRSAIWAPVPDLGLVAVWNDDDALHSEPRAPYQHVREVALLRSEMAGAGLLLASTSRTPEVQRLVESGWLGELGVDRQTVHAATPRVVATADSWESERDPVLARARLPQAAWKAAREGLEGRHGEPGPVLVQVGRSGFIPALSCQDCGTPARCRHCTGPLGYPDRTASARNETACRWCGRRERQYECPECGSHRLRAGSRGVDRTADELGRAFPDTPILSSSGDHILSTVDGTPALVVATIGAEPVAEGGYAAALLLDGDNQLQREGLRTPGQVLSRWFAAAALVRPRQDGGVAVVTASQEDVVGALVRMDAAGYASRQLAERRELGLPPAVRMAEVSGPADAVAAFMDLVGPLGGPSPLPWVGPVPVGDDAGFGHADGSTGPVRHRALLFFPYSAARRVVESLRAARAAASARRLTEPVRLRIDPVDLP
ncbi:primosomal protein N' [Citricoccus sp.]|uniref:primosomal protein N' family DNA-binding protein n=1 Tax=Citricoccus sp. TaxID=1978372 RepID=UPI00262EA145|nr:primosomal protein N' [Citricoccus sp.]HRO30156.1 primosomal protein N' [Citricoccus sp.]